MEGFSLMDDYSLANLDYSQPSCVQQYVSIDAPREIDCGISDSIITGIYSMGIVSSTQDYYQLTYCENVF